MNVTQEDIDNGKRNHSYSCPLAISLSRALGKEICVVGGKSSISSQIGAIAWFDGIPHKLPAKAAEFMIEFDTGRKVTPFEFEF